MSRCFPYSRSGFEARRIDDEEAMLRIQSIEREEEKAKKRERKEKKREKKEKKREKKEKKKEKEKSRDGEVEKNKSSHKERHEEKRGDTDHTTAEEPKRLECELEHKEKSNLTEEHDQPVAVPNLYDSSDSTQNSNKRKRHGSPPSEGSPKQQCTMLRIRLPLLKHKEMDVPPSKEQVCPVSGRSQIMNQKMANVAPRASKEQSQPIGKRDSKKMVGIASAPSREQGQAISERNQNITQKMVARSSKEERANSKRSETQKMVGIAPRSGKEQFLPLPGRTETVTPKMVDCAGRPSKKHSLASYEDSRGVGKQQPVISERRELVTEKMVDIASRSTKEALRFNPGREETQKMVGFVPGPDKEQLRQTRKMADMSSRPSHKQQQQQLRATCNAPSLAGELPYNSGKQEIIPRKTVDVNPRPRPVSGRTESSGGFAAVPGVVSGRSAVKPSQKQPSAVQPPCARPEIIAQNVVDIASAPSKEELCSTSGRSGEPSRARSKKKRPLDVAEAQFVDLIEKWVPAPIQSSNGLEEDLDWLLNKSEAKRQKVSDGGATCSLSSLWPPRATFLPEGDIYALPYTVPL